ncbi:MAG: hypothetical protein MJ200_05860 [Mycoplasmoidaceae bacterium]|nr:hypothetical protein [Mycoplasmoidaceae bacterium]
MFSTDDGQTWTRLDALTRSENNRRALEENELSSNLSLESRQFVDGCTINADVLLEKSASLNSPNDAHFAKVTLRYSYENAPDQVVEVPIDPTETSGFPISRDAFVQIENQYNKARLYYESFENNTFQQDLDAMHSQKVMQDVVMGLTATFDSIFIATSLMPTTNPKQKACNIAYVITSTIDLALQIASYSVFRVYK